MNKLFVYGTLKPGEPNEHILQDIGGSFERAYVLGKLLHIGWGSLMGYPGIKLLDGGEKVDGFLFFSEELENHWDDLDKFEGAAYQRVLTKVRLIKNDEDTDAFIYELR